MLPAACDLLWHDIGLGLYFTTMRSMQPSLPTHFWPLCSLLYIKLMCPCGSFFILCVPFLFLAYFSITFCVLPCAYYSMPSLPGSHSLNFPTLPCLLHGYPAPHTVPSFSSQAVSTPLQTFMLVVLLTSVAFFPLRIPCSAFITLTSCWQTQQLLPHARVLPGCPALACAMATRALLCFTPPLPLLRALHSLLHAFCFVRNSKHLRRHAGSRTVSLFLTFLPIPVLLFSLPFLPFHPSQCFYLCSYRFPGGSHQRPFSEQAILYYNIYLLGCLWFSYYY